MEFQLQQWVCKSSKIDAQPLTPQPHRNRLDQAGVSSTPSQVEHLCMDERKDLKTHDFHLLGKFLRTWIS